METIREYITDVLGSRLTTTPESKPGWPDREMTEQFECYRTNYHMNHPMDIRVFREYQDQSRGPVQRPPRRLEELYVSSARLDYMSPVHIMRPNSERMIVRPVKIGYMSTEALVNLRIVDPSTGLLVESIDDGDHRELILTLLRRLFPESVYGPGAVERLATDEYMETLWIPAFTHKSYNPNIGQNYEKLEFIGDAVMSASFRAYLLSLYPDFQEGEYTAISSHYLSTVEQAKMADRLQLMAAIRSNVMPSPQMAEDVLEAFYGVLSHIVGLNFINAFTREIYKDVEIDTAFRHQDHKTSVIQYFTRRKMPAPSEIFKTQDGLYTTSLVVRRRRDLQELQRYLPDILYDQTNDGYVIASGRPDAVRRAASMSAYDDMFETISSQGSFELQEPGLESRYVRCLDRRYGDNYRDYRAVNLGGSSTFTVMGIEATNLTSGLQDIILTMSVPTISADQRRIIRSTFLTAVCDALQEDLGHSEIPIGSPLPSAPLREDRDVFVPTRGIQRGRGRGRGRRGRRGGT